MFFAHVEGDVKTTQWKSKLVHSVVSFHHECFGPGGTLDSWKNIHDYYIKNTSHYASVTFLRANHKCTKDPGNCFIYHFSWVFHDLVSNGLLHNGSLSLARNSIIKAAVKHTIAFWNFLDLTKITSPIQYPTSRVFNLHQPRSLGG